MEIIQNSRDSRDSWVVSLSFLYGNLSGINPANPTNPTIYT